MTSALLILELVGVALIWALTSLTAVSASPTRPSSGPNTLLYGVILFVWTSGLSALSVLLALGLGGLNGCLYGPFLPLGLAAPQGGVGLAEGLLATVLAFKFLIGGGQFILLA